MYVNGEGEMGVEWGGSGGFVYRISRIDPFM